MTGMRVALSIFLIGAAYSTVGRDLSATRAAKQSAASTPYLIGRGPCVAIEEGQTVNTGAHLLSIVPGKNPVDVSVEELGPWTARSVGGPRRPVTACMHWFEEDVTDDSGDRRVRNDDVAGAVRRGLPVVFVRQLYTHH